MPDSTSKVPTLVDPVGPGLKKVLWIVLGLFALLGVNSVYLLVIRSAGWWTGEVYENFFSLCMFLVHLALGLLLIVPVVAFGVLHIRNVWNHRNRRAVRAGYALFATSLIILATGVLLTRVEGLLEMKDSQFRDTVFWIHVGTPLVACWLFVLHRLAGPRIRWRVGGAWLIGALIVAVIAALFHLQDPRAWNREGPASGEQYFFPSLARTVTGDFIDAEVLDNTEYCKECHADAHEQWAGSVHRFGSFNNPAYLFSVRETRRVALERDGDVQAARFCAGCHDPVVFFSGAFDDPNFDDEKHPTAAAGITCTSCHAITHINSVRGNSDYTIEEPLHYPFAFSDNAALRWVNSQLVKARPGLHKKTFLKDFHREAEFCGTCHKVHLPEELNKYKWLRGQNHYDSHLLSGVSGHGVTSFYYPPKAKPGCNECHMQPKPSEDFGARILDDSGRLAIHDHQFPSANTAVPHLLGLPEWVNEAHRSFLKDIVRVDLFGLRKGGTIDGELLAPLRGELPVLEPGQTYLLEVVIRTLGLGHHLTQGTADSNEIWLETTLEVDGRVQGTSGARDDTGAVDPWSHFVNAYVLDRHGNRVDRRNAQDIFVALYNHQIPPGAGDVVHYRFRVPDDARDHVAFDVKLHYRKFDTVYMKHVFGPDTVNDLPITTMAEDRVVLPVAGGGASTAAPAPDFPLWQRWNDYGIGLLRKGAMGSSKGQLRQAEEAFGRVEELGRGDGPLNLARVYLKEGRLEEAVDALRRAANFDPPAPPWTVAWLTGQVNRQNGFLDEAIQAFRDLESTSWQEAQDRGFDFSRDYRLLNVLGETLFDRAKIESGAERDQYLSEALATFERALTLDPENVTAHYNLGFLYSALGNKEKAEEHRALHGKYKPDDHARGQAIAIHRASHPAADHAAEAIVINDLPRAEASQAEGEGR